MIAKSTTRSFHLTNLPLENDLLQNASKFYYKIRQLFLLQRAAKMCYKTHSVVELMNILDTFSKFSGLKPNKSKCEIAGIGALKRGACGTLWYGMY